MRNARIPCPGGHERRTTPCAKQRRPTHNSNDRQAHNSRLFALRRPMPVEISSSTTLGNNGSTSPNTNATGNHVTEESAPLLAPLLCTTRHSAFGPRRSFPCLPGIQFRQCNSASACSAAAHAASLHSSCHGSVSTPSCLPSPMCGSLEMLSLPAWVNFSRRPYELSHTRLSTPGGSPSHVVFTAGTSSHTLLGVVRSRGVTEWSSQTPGRGCWCRGCWPADRWGGCPTRLPSTPPRSQGRR